VFPSVHREPHDAVHISHSFRIRFNVSNKPHLQRHSKFHTHFLLLRPFQKVRQARGSAYDFIMRSLLQREVAGHVLNPHARRPDLIRCPRPLQYLYYCPPHQAVVSFTRSLRAPHATVTRDLHVLNMSACLLRNKIHSSSHFLPPFLRLQSGCCQGSCSSKVQR
jgi:hypothetical protein